MGFEGCQWGVIGPFYRSDHISLKLFFIWREWVLTATQGESSSQRPPHQPSAKTEGHVKTEGRKHLENQCAAGKRHCKDEYAALVACAANPSLRFHMNDGDTQ